MITFEGNGVKEKYLAAVGVGADHCPAYKAHAENGK